MIFCQDVNAGDRPRWDTLDCNEPASTELAAALGVSPVARLLCQRGLSDPELAERFLNPSLDHLHDPMLLADMGVAVDRILAAIARKEKIAIHGDYDVDGVTSTVILRRALELLGGDVIHFIPERLKDGYGLQPVAIERLHADGVALVISVDCGIRGAEAGPPRARARRRSDHHRPSRTGHRAAASPGDHQPEATRLQLSRQVPRGSRRGTQAGTGALSPRGPRQADARLHQGRRHRYARRRRAAGRREPRDRETGAGAADQRGRTRSACAR
jgi:hypothetical protein